MKTSMANRPSHGHGGRTAPAGLKDNDHAVDGVPAETLHELPVHFETEGLDVWTNDRIGRPGLRIRSQGGS